MDYKNIELNVKIDFTGKTAIVTGGTRGIGRSIVTLLLKSGCHVIYTGTNEHSKSPIKNGKYEQLDLSDKNSFKRFTEEVINKTQNIDILINNAGINIIEPIYEIQNNNWEEVLAINLTGSMLMMREVSKVMKSQIRGGKILNISSIFGVVSKSKRCSYSASKTGLIGLTRASALDLAPFNILVNSLCPGFTNTELTSSILSTEDKISLEKEIPLGRYAEVSEIAKMAIFVCSDLNTYMTGQTIIVDGGFTIE